MKKTKVSVLISVVLFATNALIGQTFTSVPLDNPAYRIIQQCEQRGLCTPQGSVKPYSEYEVVKALKEILSNAKETETGSLTLKERQVIKNLLVSFEKQQGIDWNRGEFYYKNSEDISIPMTLNIAANWQSIFSNSLQLPNSDITFGTDNWGTLTFSGDMGNNLSWSISAGGGIIRSPRKQLGIYYPYYKGFTSDSDRDNTPFVVYSQPLAFFPYSFQKKWDGSVFYASNLSSSGFYEWPQDVAFGYNILSEIDASFLDNRIFFRWGRFSREIGAMLNGNSLFLNANARPFLGLEVSFKPFNWLSFSALTGVLEYYNNEGISLSAEDFQNAFSLALLETGYKNYFSFSFGSSVVWPKRFELGYLFPLNSNFFYQNNIGDFDNMAIFLNLSGTLPNVGKLWFSVFVDEVDFSSPDFFHQDRNMYAWQIGTNATLPMGNFSNVSIQYTKIEPYTYTHQKTKVPWYGNSWMDTAYVNNGVGLGYYLPPNSDEVKLRFETLPTVNTSLYLQYQMIRHGTDWGSRAVDGSNLGSELDPTGRNEKDALKKFFLHDGAYQWQHILKVGGQYDFSKNNIPVLLFGEVGIVFSYFTDVNGAANSGYSQPFHVINTSEYPITTDIIATLGVRVYP